MSTTPLLTQSAKDRIVDAIDIETFFYCKDKAEARQLANTLMAEMSLPQGDIVFLEHNGLGARVRLRSYVHLPGDHYSWLEDNAGEKT